MKRLMTALALSGVCLVCALAVPVQAETKNASEAQIRKLIEVTDAASQTKKMVPAIIRHIWGQVMLRAPNVSEAAKKEITEKMVDAMTKMAPLFLELTIPVYQRHLTSEEADAAIAFYSTPLGKSFASKAGTIAVESMQAGAQMGQQMAKRAAEIAVENLRKKGYQL